MMLYNISKRPDTQAGISNFLFLYTMETDIYFDISSEESGGSLYRFKKADGSCNFLYKHSTYDDYRDEIKVFETAYASFDAFWKELVSNKEWHYLHPLYIHPEQRTFIQEQLKSVNWGIYPDKKWQESHQRQWKKVLTDPDEYYQK